MQAQREVAPVVDTKIELTAAGVSKLPQRYLLYVWQGDLLGREVLLYQLPVRCVENHQ